MKILVIDNYDSFVYNIVHIIKEVGIKDIDIVKNDKIDLSKIDQYDKILLSPGPGIPSEAGKLIEVIKQYATTKDILGVCLGHQALGEYFGMQLKRLKEPLHGIASPIYLQHHDYLFDNVQNYSSIGHYHSWVIDSPTSDLIITAKDQDGNIMAFKHKSYNVRGVQFHPESVLTEEGKQMISNWIKN